MKLAAALQERADLNKKIADLRSRIEQVILVQEGEKPAEDPAKLITELEACINRLEHLMVAINRTNSQTVVDGQSLTEIIAKRDAIQMKIGAYRDFAHEAITNTRRARNSEIKVIPVLKATDLQKKLDAYSKELRETDNLLQEKNWTFDLIE
jgi:hypothetical protein